MTSYALWNNKGGVGKSFLCFVAATEYAHRHPDTDVYVIDLCPQANVSETIIGDYTKRAKILNDRISKTPRATVAGYLEARLSSPFRMIEDIEPFITKPDRWNKNVPSNIFLICGDNLLEIISEAIRQTSQLSIPINAWQQVISWIRDLVFSLKARSNTRKSVFVIDCNPSFAIYTQLALVASDFVVVPFTADDSSRRAIENVAALLYGVADPSTAAYARISFSRRALEEKLSPPKLHTFVSNRVTLYEGKASKAFDAVSRTIKHSIDRIYDEDRTIFSNPTLKPSKQFVEVPDYHSASIVSSMMGTPLHRLKAGPTVIEGDRIQINKGPLDRYRHALEKFVDRL